LIEDKNTSLHTVLLLAWIQRIQSLQRAVYKFYSYINQQNFVI